MNLEGGCACRTIRYRLTETPFDRPRLSLPRLSASDRRSVCDQPLDRAEICRKQFGDAEVAPADRRHRKAS
jgi:hypothetical protein